MQNPWWNGLGTCAGERAAASMMEVNAVNKEETSLRGRGLTSCRPWPKGEKRALFSEHSR